MSKELFFIWVYFFIGAGGALGMIRLSEMMFGKVFNLLQKTIEVDKVALNSIEDENKKLEDEKIKLQEVFKKLENKRKQLEDVYFERIIGQEVR